MAGDDGHLVALVHKWRRIFFGGGNVQKHAGRFVAEVALGNGQFIGSWQHILEHVLATCDSKALVGCQKIVFSDKN